MENIFQMNSNANNETHLPPGFRFHPTDEELITYYLIKKVLDSSFTVKAIAEVDLNKCEPWDLPGKAKMGEKEWYFYSLRDRKYPTGLRTNRATGSGYWKATGKDREIYSSKTSALVGMKKTLVFYKGRAPKGGKSNWVMHEYRLEGKLAYHYLSSSSKDEWVISRVFSKSGGGTTPTTTASSIISMSSFGTSTGGGGGKKKGHGNGGSGSGCIYSSENIGSPISSSTLPPLLDSSPYVPHAADRSDSCSTYENENVAVAREQHVPCFSTLTNAGNNNNLLMMNQNHSSSSSGGFGSTSSPSLMMMINQSNNHQHPQVVDPPMQTQQQLGWSGELSAFQGLRSLQEKLQMPFFYSALAPPHHDHPMSSSDPPQQYHQTNEINGGCISARTSWMFNDHASDNQHQKVEKNRMQVGNTEFDCLWTY
ncbi:hypothetical protein C5167_039517 [Papaver somniferum]|uniref:NAC domain-containing protein n=1 Tax=Papaver somniferum TaxID=3469 RepID=A0A4Y7IFU0_PAPSO|nr:protein CUP-SHAPED COTYLEDON 2-like [Papaver somniferum]RZC46571.1 hypothetical protein C5167_039517 [Papaver somniferum]